MIDQLLRTLGLGGLGPHGGYILAAYLFSLFALTGLLGWIIKDGREQVRRVAHLEHTHRRGAEGRDST